MGAPDLVGGVFSRGGGRGDGAGEQIAQGPPVGVGEVEQGRRPSVAAGAQHLPLTLALLAQDEVLDAPVGGVGLTGDETTAFQPVDDARARAWAGGSPSSAAAALNSARNSPAARVTRSVSSATTGSVSALMAWMLPDRFRYRTVVLLNYLAYARENSSDR
jgi:hypothetical protein